MAILLGDFRFGTKPLFEQLCGNSGQRDERPVGAKHAIGGKHMDVRVEGRQIAEGLHEQDQPRPALDPGAGIGLDQQSLHDVSQLPKQSAPATQGISVLQMLNLLEHYELGAMEYLGADQVHFLVQAKQLAYHDRDRWIADPAFAEIPLERLLSRSYAEERRALIDPARALPQIQLQAYVAMIDFGLNVQQAIESPRWLSSRFALGEPRDPLNVEGRYPGATLKELERRGHVLNRWGAWNELAGHAHGITIDPVTGARWGGSDPRSDEAAIGY